MQFEPLRHNHYNAVDSKYYHISTGPAGELRLILQPQIDTPWVGEVAMRWKVVESGSIPGSGMSFLPSER
jgi:hypothetical protein